MFACTATDHQSQPVRTADRLTVQNRPDTSRPCRQIIWRDYNANRYDYRFDASHRLSQCTAFEQTNGYGVYVFKQQLTYTKHGLLEWVRDEEDSSRYQYRNGRLEAIYFVQEGQLVYRYVVTTNEQGQIVGLRGEPLNNSGLLAYTTRYRLDAQGRYVQLDVEDERGVLYYRVKQSDFVPATGHLNGLLGGIPYDLNRSPWLNWGQGFPISPYLARRIETYQYAAPLPATELIKRADVSIRWQRDKQGHITGLFTTDAMTTIRDTVLIDYINCP